MLCADSWFNEFCKVDATRSQQHANSSQRLVEWNFSTWKVFFFFFPSLPLTSFHSFALNILTRSSMMGPKTVVVFTVELGWCWSGGLYGSGGLHFFIFSTSFSSIDQPSPFTVARSDNYSLKKNTIPFINFALCLLSCSNALPRREHRYPAGPVPAIFSGFRKRD